MIKDSLHANFFDLIITTCQNENHIINERSFWWLRISKSDLAETQNIQDSGFDTMTSLFSELPETKKLDFIVQ